MKKYEKRERGITLIALVITIIVLLILAGIAIAALSGKNGILTRASEAKEKTGREEIIEKAKLQILEYQTENEGKITDEKALEIISKYDKEYKENETFEFKTNESEEEYFTTKEGYDILVSEIWKVKKKIHFTFLNVEFTANEGETLRTWFNQKENYEETEIMEVMDNIVSRWNDNRDKIAGWVPGGDEAGLGLNGKGCRWGDKLINGGNYIIELVNLLEWE